MNKVLCRPNAQELPQFNCSLAAIFLLLAVATICTTLATADEPADHRVDQATDVLDTLDRTLVSFDYRDQPLAQILADLNERASVPIRADWMALDLFGIFPETVLTISLNNVSMSTALAGIALQIGDGFNRAVYEFHNGQIVITTLAATARMRMVAVYNIRDLLVDEATVTRMKAQRPVPDAVSEDSNASDTDSSIADDADVLDREATLSQRDRTPGEAMLELIADHVDPDAWLEFGGNRARISEHNGVLMVSAPATVHKKLRDAIGQLRRAIPNHVWFDAAILSVPHATYEMHARRFRPATAALGRAIMLDDDAIIHWRCRSGSVAIDEEFLAEFSSHNETGTHALSVSCTPRLMPETGMLRLHLNINHQMAADVREVRTVIACPSRDSAAIFEMGGSDWDESMKRLVIILPRAG